MDEGNNNTPDKPPFVFDPQKKSEASNPGSRLERMSHLSSDMATAARYNAEGFVKELSSRGNPENRLSSKQIENVVSAMGHWVGLYRTFNPQEEDVFPVDKTRELPIIQTWVKAFGAAVRDQIDPNKTSQ